MQQTKNRDIVPPPDGQIEGQEPSLQEKLQAILDRAGGKLTPEDFFEGASLIRETTRDIPQTDGGVIQRQMRDERAGLLDE